MKHLTLCCLILLLSAGCKESRKATSRSGARYTIDMAQAEAGKSDAALSIARYVKLQTSDRALINQIVKVVPYRDRLFILTAVPQNGVMLFSDKGAFITKIMKGRAHNETLYPTDISVDEANGHLMILDFYRQVKIFTLDGKYVSRYSLSDPQFNLESIGKEGKCLFYSMSMFPKNKYAGYYGDGGRELQGVYRCPYRGQGAVNFAGLTKFSQDSILICPLVSDTVYLFDTRCGRLDPYFVLDRNGRNGNPADKVRALKSMEEYKAEINSGRMFPGPTNVHYANNKLFFRFYAGDDAFYVFDTNGNELKRYSRMFEELPNFYGKIGQIGGQVVVAYETNRLNRHFRKNPPASKAGKELQELCRNEEDNPLLVFANIN